MAFLPATFGKKILMVVIAVLMLGAGAGTAYKVASSTPSAEVAETVNVEVKEVAVATVLELSLQSEPIVTVGNVVSANEATIRAEASGELVRLYKDLGDYVTRGELIGQIEQQSEAAALAQAKAGLASAEAAAKISGSGSKSSNELLAEAIVGARNTLDGTYDDMIEAVEVKADALFSNPKSTFPHFNPVVTNSQLETTIENNRSAVTELLQNVRTRKSNVDSLTTVAALQAEIDLTRNDATTVKKLIDAIVASLSQVVVTPDFSETIRESYKASLGAAQTSLSGSLSSLSTSKDTLTAKAAQAQAGELQGGAGDTTSSAAVALARAGVDAATANVERKNIRASISGTINGLEVEEGDTVNGGSTIAVIGNNQALEIRTYVTETERGQLSNNGKALINGIVPGVVTRIAPSVDPRTRKVEVKVLPTGNTEGFENGVAVEVRLFRDVPVSAANVKLSVPVSAVKITAEGAVVFALKDGILVEQPIVEGPLLGKSIVVENGLSEDTLIAIDARGLKAGTRVKVVSQ